MTRVEPLSDELNMEQELVTEEVAESALDVPAVEPIETVEYGTGEEEKVKLMSLVGHLTELRQRLIISLLCFFGGSIFGWFYATPFIQYIGKNVGPFVFVSPSEAFLALLKLSLAIGLVISSPVLLAQLWLFIMPGLLPREVFFFRRYVPLIMLLFLVGLVFAHFTVYPIALKFFLGFGSAKLEAKLAISRFLGFFLAMHLPFGVMFELPVVLLTLVKAGLLRVEFLIKQRKVAYLGAFVIGALLTPPDPVSQVLMAVPMLVLYEISLFLARRVKPIAEEVVQKSVLGGEDE